ncbi:MAG TPA: alcohol dehydrogenase catalytic domain-containing protein [Candidatus Dormibacteraeota bacterium]
MQAAVYRGRDQVHVEEWPEPPDPPAGWLQVDVGWCGICGTDLDEILHGPVLVPRTPMVLGHEAAGTVVKTGHGVALAVGARVGLENSLGCGSCARCLAGDPQLCASLAVMGLMFDGALAARVNVPASMCAPLPEALSEEAGALAEPLSVAVRAVRRAGGVRGRSVGVVGAGTIGLLVAAVAKARGAARVCILERDPGRRERARGQGYETAAGGEELDVVFECAGSGPGFQAALDATAKQGTTVVVGIHAEPRPFDVTDFVVDERALVASFSHNLKDDYRAALDLLAAGAVDPAAFITDRVPLADVVEHGFEPLIREPARHLKVLVDCRAGR